MEQSYDNPVFQSEQVVGNNNVVGVKPLSEGNIITAGDIPAFEQTSMPSSELNIINGKSVKTEGASLWHKGRALLYQRRGLLFATGAALFFSVENLFMEVLANTLSIFEISAAMSALEIFLTFAGILIAKKRFPNTKRQYFSLLISGLFLAAGMPLALESLKHMEVGDSITIIYTMPIFAGIFSWIILRESLRIVDCLFALLSLVGVVLIARPPFIFGSIETDSANGDNPLLGAAYALASAISFALLVVAARKQSVMGLHPIVILFCNVVVSFVTNTTICTLLVQWTLPTKSDWGFIVGLACLDVLAQTLIYAAVVVEVAMYVSIITTSEVIFTFIWQFIFLAVAPKWLTAAGAVFILASCIGMATKREMSKNESEGAKTQKGEPIQPQTVPSISVGVGTPW